MLRLYWSSLRPPNVDMLFSILTFRVQAILVESVFVELFENTEYYSVFIFAFCEFQLINDEIV